MRRTRRLVVGASALAGTVVIVVGIPVGLIRYVGWPFPDRLPSIEEISLALRSGIDPELLINLLAIIVWVAWLQLVAALAFEVVAAIRGRTARKAPVLPVIQVAAARLVATITLAAATLAPMRPDVALAHPPPTVTVEAHGETTLSPYSIQPAETEPHHSRLGVTAERPMVTVGRFDTLWTIAETRLGDARRWKEIRDLNIGRHTSTGGAITETTEHVPPGTTLDLPDDATLPTTDEHPTPGEVAVQRGDSFWSIAQQTLADAWGRSPTDSETTVYWKQLIEANRERLQPPYDPDLIYPGQVFKLPPSPKAPVVEETRVPTGEVTVQRGDSFWSIAQQILADAWGRPPTDSETTGYWRQLIEANRERLQAPYDPDVIYPDQVFQLPPTDTVDTARRTTERPSLLDTEAEVPSEAEGEVETITREFPDEAHTAGEPSEETAGDEPIVDEPSEAEAPLEITTPTTPGVRSQSNKPADLDAESVAASPADQDRPLLPIAVGLGGLGLLAAGTIALLDRLRRVQLRQRRPGTTPTPPPATTAETESRLRAAAAPTATELISLSLRALAHQLTDQHIPQPDVVGVHLNDHLLSLLLWTPHSDPPSGWQVDDDGTSWTLPTTVDPTHLHCLADNIPAPYPSLVTVGNDDTGGQLLLDLEHVGAAQITGEPDDVVAALHTMAVELATSEIADQVDVVCVGFGGNLAHLERITAVNDLGGILSTIDQRTSVLDKQNVTPLEGRMAPGGDAWAPIVILDPSPSKPEDSDRLLAVAHRGRAVSAVVGYPTGGQWRFQLSDDNITIHPLGYTFHRRDLTPTEATGIVDLTRAAKDLDGVPEALVAPPPSALPTQLSESGPDSDSEESTHQRIEVTEPTRAPPEVRTLGNVRVDGITEPFPAVKSLEFVTYLVLHRQGVEPDTLMEALFPGEPPKTDRLNKVAYRARLTLGDTPDGTPYVPYFYGTDPYQISTHLRCDLERFNGHIQTADGTDNRESISHLQAALEIVEGPPFTAKKGYGWAHSEGISTHTIVAIDNAAHHLAARALDGNEPELTTWAARKGLTAVWACEECYRNLMRAAIAQHDHTAFEAVYSELNTLLEEEQGPDATDWLEPETVNLYHQHRQRRRNAG
jgi:nucleoid-associated protein YgaU